MAETVTKLPVRDEPRERPAVIGWEPFQSVRREMDRLFDDFRFDMGHPLFRRGLFDLEPAWRREMTPAMPAVDVAERDDAYEITAELPGMSEKDVEVKYADGVVTITGEKTEKHDEKKKDYHFSERRYGSFRRTFTVPTDVDANKLAAHYADGVLTVTLPKSAEAQTHERKIAVTTK